MATSYPNTPKSKMVDIMWLYLVITRKIRILTSKYQVNMTVMQHCQWCYLMILCKSPSNPNKTKCPINDIVQHYSHVACDSSMESDSGITPELVHATCLHYPHANVHSKLCLRQEYVFLYPFLLQLHFMNLRREAGAGSCSILMGVRVSACSVSESSQPHMVWSMMLPIHVCAL